jgi:hypothetical protein
MEPVLAGRAYEVAHQLSQIDLLCAILNSHRSTPLYPLSFQHWGRVCLAHRSSGHCAHR